MATVKPESSPKLEISEVQEKVWKVKNLQGKGYLKIGVEKKHGDASSLFLEINNSRKFEIGNDCDTCHFWFKCLSEPRPGTAKKIANLPKTLSLPRSLSAEVIQELSPMLEIMEKGEYYVYLSSSRLAGPYAADDETSYFYNNEFLELWNIEDPAQEGLLSDWEHYEGSTPRLYRHENFLEKQFDFVIPLVPRRQLKEEYIKLYQQMFAAGDRPRVLMLGMLQRPVPAALTSGKAHLLHAFSAGFVLDGNHKLAAYKRAGVPVPTIVILSLKASKFALAKDEGSNSRQKLEERLASIAV